MARPGDVNAPLEILTLALEGDIFALDAGSVLEILDEVPVTHVPNAKPFVDGLINVRGKVLPLADIRLKFGMARSVRTVDSRVVVVQMILEEEPIQLGILADKVIEVTTISVADIEPTPEIGMKWRPEFIRCIGKKNGDFIAVLNLENIILSKA